MKKLLLTAMALLTTTVIAAPLEGHVETELRYNKIEHLGIPVHVESAHRATVTNNSTALKHVFVYYKLCINSVCDDKKRYRINLKPKSTWSDGLVLQMNPYLTIPTIYAVYAITGVVDDKGNDIIAPKSVNGVIQVKQ